MYKEQVYVTTNVALVMDGIVVILAGYGAYYLRWLLGGGAEWGMEGGMFIAIVMSLMFVNCYVLGQLGFYASDFNPPFWMALRKVVLAVAIDFSLVTMGLFFIMEEPLSRMFLGIYAGLVFLGLMIVRALFFHFFRHSSEAYRVWRVLLVGSSDRVQLVFDAFKRQKSWGHTLVGSLAVGPLFEIEGLPCLGMAEDLANMISENDVDEVVFTVPGDVPFDFPAYLDICKEMGLTCRIVPRHVHPRGRPVGAAGGFH